MPLYEYYCDDCDGVFELLRPTRDAAKPQPCPQCDNDGRRIMPREWAAYIYRQGSARRLPDDGTFWHNDKKVSRPISGTWDGFSHPDLKREEPPKEATMEDLERYEELAEQRRKMEVETGGMEGGGVAGVREQQLLDKVLGPANERVARERGRIFSRNAHEDARARREISGQQRSRTPQQIEDMMNAAAAAEQEEMEALEAETTWVLPPDA